MIVKNSRLPRKPQEIARLNVEYRRYQGYENLAVGIGLVNEPRHTKNGHLMFGLEDETGEMNCLLTIRQGDDRDRMHEQVVEAGLMPDDVLGVSGSFSQTGDIFYVDDLFFPMKDRHEKKSADFGVSVAFLSDIHVGSKTFLEAQWHKMVRWFHTDPLAKTIKYLILSGDCVDGVGIYPGQDKELSILICLDNTVNLPVYWNCCQIGLSASCFPEIMMPYALLNHNPHSRKIFNKITIKRLSLAIHVISPFMMFVYSRIMANRLMILLQA